MSKPLIPVKKGLVAFVLLLALSAVVAGQSNVKKIKVILVGTFHFNQSLDSTSKLHSNILSARRQAEIKELTDIFIKQKPDKIFLEFTEKNQPYYDSIYKDYLMGREPQQTRVKANEIFQLGMKTAKALGHKKVFGMNYQPEELADSAYVPANKVAQAIKDLYLALNNFEDTTRTNQRFYDLPFPYRFPNQDSLLQKSTLKQFLLQLLLEKKLQRDEYTNWNYLYSMGTGGKMDITDYVGTFWYGTNLRNFNNVLRQVDYPKDNCYLIIYGSSHIPILRYFFSMHPYFEIVDIDNLLR